MLFKQYSARLFRLGEQQGTEAAEGGNDDNQNHYGTDAVGIGKPAERRDDDSAGTEGNAEGYARGEADIFGEVALAEYDKGGIGAVEEEAERQQHGVDGIDAVTEDDDREYRGEAQAAAAQDADIAETVGERAADEGGGNAGQREYRERAIADGRCRAEHPDAV